MRSFADIFYDCDYMLLSLLDMSLFDSAGASIPPELDESAAGALEGTLVDLLEASLEEDDFLAGDFFAAFLRGDDFFAAFFAPFFAAFFAPFLGALLAAFFLALFLEAPFFFAAFLAPPFFAAFFLADFLDAPFLEADFLADFFFDFAIVVL